MRFESPFYLLLLLILPLLYLYYRRFLHHSKAVLRYSQVGLLRQRKKDWKIAAVEYVFPVRLALLALLITALGRPQTGQSYEQYLTDGIDIVMAIDASGSMMAEDFAPKNRLEVAKEKAAEFIKGRKGDRIGMVVFGEESFTLCPLTLDYPFLLKRVNELHIGIVPEDKTAVGMALANALNRLRSSSAKSKVIILLTDGMNNTGKIDPLTAAEMAKTLKIKIYTIGIGKEGIVRIPVQNALVGQTYAQMKTEIDEATLQKIADNTGGLYFRADSERALQKIYKTIDGLEKTKVEVKVYTDYKEIFPYLLWPAFLLFLIERILARSVLRTLP